MLISFSTEDFQDECDEDGNPVYHEVYFKNEVDKMFHCKHRMKEDIEHERRICSNGCGYMQYVESSNKYLSDWRDYIEKSREATGHFKIEMTKADSTKPAEEDIVDRHVNKFVKDYLRQKYPYDTEAPACIEGKEHKWGTGPDSFLSKCEYCGVVVEDTMTPEEVLDPMKYFRRKGI